MVVATKTACSEAFELMNGLYQKISVDDAWECFLKWEKRSKDTIAFRKIYVRMAGGDVLAGLLLSQIVYWFTPTKDGDYKTTHLTPDNKQPELYKYRKDWNEEICFSLCQVDRAMKVLSTDFNLINVRRTKFNGNQCQAISINKLEFITAWYQQCKEDCEK